jgi:hypothetical protein
MIKKKTKPMVTNFIIREILKNNFLAKELEDWELVFLNDLSPHQLMKFKISYLEALDFIFIIHGEFLSREKIIS